LKQVVKGLPKIGLAAERYAAETGKVEVRDIMNGLIEHLRRDEGFTLVRSPAKAQRQT